MKPDSHLLSCRHRPNDSIFLENTSITHISGCHLPEPLQACVRLHLYPQIGCRIESKNLPKQLIKTQHEPFHITTASGFRTKVFLRYNLNDLMSLGNFFKGYLIPSVSPCMVIDPNADIRSVTFGVLNFQEFYGRNDKFIDIDGSSRRLGSSVITLDNFRIEITENPDLSENKKFLRRNDGYTVTHVGLIERCDRKTYRAMDAANILRAIRAFLSFARGAACGLILVKAVMPNGTDAILEWGTTHTESWLCGSETWLPTNDGGDILSRLFPQFLDLCCNPDWKDTMFTVIDWYLNCNVAPFHVGIILAQAALESLSYKVLQRKFRSKHEQISRALSSLGISESIPGSCSRLARWLTSAQTHDAKGPGDGPDAITKIRNDLVHAHKKCESIPPEAQMDAFRLSQWYMEMMLLRKLGHDGRYRNRVSAAGRGALENVPWAAKASTPATNGR